MSHKQSDNLTDRQYALLNTRYRAILRSKLTPTLSRTLLALLRTKIRNTYFAMYRTTVSSKKEIRAVFRDMATTTFTFTQSRAHRDILIVCIYDNNNRRLLDITIPLSLEEFKHYLYLTVALVEFYGDGWTNQYAKIHEYSDRGIEIAMWDSLILFMAAHIGGASCEVVIDVLSSRATVAVDGDVVRFALSS